MTDFDRKSLRILSEVSPALGYFHQPSPLSKFGRIIAEDGVLGNMSYGVGPRVLPTTDGKGFNSLRHTDEPNPDRGERALILIRRSAEGLRSKKSSTPREMPFDSPRWKERK